MIKACLVSAAALVLLGACATPSGNDRIVTGPSAMQPPPTKVYFYPADGQSAEQQDRDRYDCYVWAVRQTGFDPSRMQTAAAPRVEVLPVPPSGQDTAAGLFTGAFLGAAVSRPRDAGSGAAIGAILGAMLGAASDTARQGQAQQVQYRYSQHDALRYSQLENRAAEYRRAMAACLEGRGYTVH